MNTQNTQADNSDEADSNSHHEQPMNRKSRWIRFVCIGIVVICFLALMRLLPIGAMVEALQGFIDDLGVWGPVLFILIYVIATIFMLPASALTLAAGVVFGLLGGTIVVSIASTTGAAAAFLISRYLARSMVEKRLGHYPKFKAVDRAVSQGGWKIVALLRLSPAVPFNLQNYLYGVTAIRFWPCVLASWIAMLPGTFMYVYLGYAGRAGVAAAAGQGQGRSPLQWVMLGVGLVATIAVTVYVTKLARRAMADQASDDSELVDDKQSNEGDQHEQGNSKPDSSSDKDTDVKTKPMSPAVTGVYVVVALAIVGLTGCAYSKPNLFKGVFGPPQAKLSETYTEKSDSPDVDHTAFNQLLGKYVNANGGVDYAGMAKERDVLQNYIKQLAKAPFQNMGRDQKLALLINAYNAFTLELILENDGQGKLESIRDIPSDKRWDGVRWNIAGQTLSLNQIEHEQIRPNFKEPRIHFALVCAAAGCPPLRSEAYVAGRLEEQLAAQTQYVHTHPKWFELDQTNDKVKLTQLYNWYGGDFEQVSGSVLEYAAQYNSSLKQMLDNNQKPSIQWLDYDWSLNSQENIQ